MQWLTRAMAKDVMAAIVEKEPGLKEATLIPVLRGGLPMYVAAQEALPDAGALLVRCSKLKSTTTVQVEWLGGRPPPDRPVILLDTLIATGDTLLKLCDELEEVAPGRKGWVIVASCYASPEGLAAVVSHPVVARIFTAAKSHTVDEHGYVVPYTHGDIGDKLFGSKSV